ncbi:MAG: formate--tetrahydrofolate ligase [Firmicutes bacterium]|nr:formate--tetrahydrofolate ligase [Bacillota bacterium]
MKDIEIARSVQLKPIAKIAVALKIPKGDIEFYGKYKAKVLTEPKKKPKGKLILVTAVNPTPFGEGKTTVSVGLADGISEIGKNVCLALREPSLGPVFGVKGGAAGGGRAQVAPMEDINLHFTGDFHAITSANNLLSSLIDNHIKQGNELGLDLNRIEWKRCLDLNDRALRVVQVGGGGEVNGIPREDGFNITAASEIMAILCLSGNMGELKQRLGNILVGYNQKGEAVLARDLQAENAMAILLKDAIFPNLVQTLEGTPAILHGGPFANIAHGCNSIRATKLAMSLSNYTVTEAGFGADLGAEKFFNIKCRTAGLNPDAVVLVATVRALKHNGESGGLQEGVKNMQGHIENLTKNFNVKTIVAINRFVTDTDQEIAIIKASAESAGVKAVVANCWAEGGKGCTELATEVVKLADSEPKKLNLTYATKDKVSAKIVAIATKIYGASKVIFSEQAKKKLDLINKLGYGSLPICIAKTQYSFSQDPKLLNRPKGFDFTVRDIQIRAGSGFLVIVAGDIMLMPGLSKIPSAVKMTIDESGKIDGLF